MMKMEYEDEDHPHACGDKLTRSTADTKPLGSSPCVWGQVGGCRRKVADDGIIPMRVGTRLSFCFEVFTSRDHPHACGDKKADININHAILGSSPCVWGQVLAAWNTYKNDRIIPMRVGTRQSYTSFVYSRRDHPHACGDKKRTPASSICTKGSSPCVWGQANTDTTKRERMRIIPMRVGTSQASQAPSDAS